MNISIVIPAYNVGKYIGRCLDSIYSQNVCDCDFEVIVINDGSKDNTENIVLNYKVKHDNLIYVKQENRGLSVARNVGFSMANNDLIWCVDSDDAVTEDSLTKIPQYFDKYPNADFLIFDRKQRYKDDNHLEYFKICGGKEGFYEQALDRKKANRLLKTAVNWHFVYRRDYILQHQLFMLPGIIHEDDESRFRIFFFAKEIRYIPYAHYIYTLMRPGSLTTVNWKASEKSYLARIKTIENWKSFADKYVKTKDDRCFYNSFLNNAYSWLLLLANTDKNTTLFKTYNEHKNEWRSKYLKTYFMSHDYSFKHFVKLLITLLHPQYFIK